MAPIIELPSGRSERSSETPGRDEADDEERRAEGKCELPPGLVEAEQRTQDRGECGEEQAEQAARAKPLQRDLQQVGFRVRGEPCLEHLSSPGRPVCWPLSGG